MSTYFLSTQAHSVKEESRKNYSGNREPAVGFYAQHDWNTGGRSQPAQQSPTDPDRTTTGLPWCTYCSRVGHTQECFYRRQGIVPPTKESSRGKSRSSSMAPTGQKSPAAPLVSANAAIQHSAGSSNQSPHAAQGTAATTHSLLGLTHDQMQQLLTFLEPSPPSVESLVDRTTRGPIEVGKMSRGVFVLQSLPAATASAINGSDSYELWHNLMGHPGSQPLYYVPVISVSPPSHK